jgi:hypothetical protein
MGAGSKWIEARSISGSRKAHHVSIGPQEDRSGTKETLGEGTGGAEEGCLGATEPAASLRQAFSF